MPDSKVTEAENKSIQKQTADEQTRFVLIHQFNPQKQAFDRLPVFN